MTKMRFKRRGQPYGALHGQAQPEAERGPSDHPPAEIVYGADSNAWNTYKARKVDEGIIGAVERTDKWRKRPLRLVVGYLLREHRNRRNVFACFSKEDGLIVFDISTGSVATEPDETREDGYCMAFGNFPDPVYHKTFKACNPAEPKNGFEPHGRGLAGSRITEMRRAGTDEASIDAYKKAVDEYMSMAADMFKENGRY